MTAPSKRSDATNEHKTGARKIDPKKVPGVSIVTDKQGNQKIAVTKVGRQRLKDEL